MLSRARVWSGLRRSVRGGSTTVLVALAALGLVATVACVGSDSDTPPAAPTDGGPDAVGSGNNPGDGGTSPNPDGGATGATLRLATPRPRVRRGASVDVELTVERASVSGELPITIGGLPEGVTAAAPPIAAGSNTSVVRFTASATAALGLAPITISAPNVALLNEVVVVMGNPGTVDTTFDSDGFFIDTTSATHGWTAAVVQPDGKVVVAGTTNINATTTATASAWVVRRFGPKGEPDPTFDTAAAAAMPQTGAARGLALAADGKIVVAGYSRATEQITVIRLNPGGSIDQGFADAGVLVADPVSHGQGSRAHAVAIDTSGKIIVAGRIGTRGVVERYLPGGTPDGMFLRFETVGDAELNGVAALSDGTYVAGGTDIAASPDIQLGVRLLSNGTPDGVYGVNGRTFASGCRGRGFAVMSDGDLFIVGDDQVSSVSACSTRQKPDGQLFTKDTGFGGSGGNLFGAVAGPEGTSYALGHGGGTQDRYGLIERRLVNGDLDPAFAAGSGTTGTFFLEDTVGTPDTFRWIMRGGARSADGQLFFVGNRTGTSSGAFIGRLWE